MLMLISSISSFPRAVVFYSAAPHRLSAAAAGIVAKSASSGGKSTVAGITVFFTALQCYL